MEKRLIECVPNFSEGCDKTVIDRIIQSIESTAVRDGDKAVVLHSDMGKAAGRTVITFAGSPEVVSEAMFRACRTAYELIDMRKHHGVHPRMGAVDVIPFVPISGVTLDECSEIARKTARRLYEELGVACYCYESAAFSPERRRLEYCRSGEYESLEHKFSNQELMPDFGPAAYNENVARYGASIVGARKFLGAVNFNLNTADASLASVIAGEIRESGIAVKEAISGSIKKDTDGKPIRKPGLLRCCKAIGWYIEEYGIAQVSTNLTDMDITSIKKAYHTTAECAKTHGADVTGTEIIGLVPLKALIGKEPQEGRPLVEYLPEIEAAVEELHLDDLRPFDPFEKILEFKLLQKE